MSLRHALLAVLTAQPMTGYDAAKAFHSSVGHVWHAPDSQIYPALRAMESEGWVAGTAVPWGTNSTKTEYSITESGLSEFRRWMSEPLNYQPQRDPAHLRAAYFEWADPATVSAQLRAHIKHFEDQRTQWQLQLKQILNLSHPLVARRIELYPADAERLVAYKAFSYEGLIAIATTEINWATSGLRLVERLNR